MRSNDLQFSIGGKNASFLIFQYHPREKYILPGFYTGGHRPIIDLGFGLF